jgi:hypothetical protein
VNCRHLSGLVTAKIPVMPPKGVRTAWALLLFGLSALPAGAAPPWIEYRNEELGVQMLVPPGVKPVTQIGGASGSVLFRAGKATTVAAVVGIGPQQPIDRLREYGVSVTRVPAGDWTRVGDPMRDTPAGFSYAESWTASDGKGLLIAILGHGPRGSYVIFVITSVDEYKKGQPEFVRWAESIKVF